MRASRLALLSALFVAAAAPSRADHAQVARGAYFAQIAACAGCHAPKNSSGSAAPFSGGRSFGKGPDVVYAPNITQDRDTGIGAWSDRQIADVLDKGVKPDGTRVRAPMPITAYRALGKDDVAALVAYLRQVPAVRNAVPASAAPSPSVEPIAAPAVAGPADRLAAGRYLANAVLHCTECHTPGPAAAPDYATRLDAGGRSFHTAEGTLVAPSITPERLKAYSDSELARAITRGVRPDGSVIVGPMPIAAYAHLTTDDVHALIAYLRGQ